MNPIKKHFVTGLAILLPLVITIAVITFLVNVLTEPFIGLVSSLFAQFHLINQGFLFLSPEELIRYSSKILILIFLFLLTVGLGMLTRWVLITLLFKLGDSVLHRIPLINTVYKTTQDIIKTLFVSDQNSFKQVVMVPFPGEGSYVLGLVAREAPKMCSDSAGKDLISVFIPTTPNPTTGFLLMFKRSDLIFIEMKSEEAIKYIISCGVIVPELKTVPGTPL